MSWKQIFLGISKTALKNMYSTYTPLNLFNLCILKLIIILIWWNFVLHVTFIMVLNFTPDGFLLSPSVIWTKGNVCWISG